MNYDKFLARYSSARDLSMAKRLCDQASIEFGSGGWSDKQHVINMFIRCDVACGTTFYQIKTLVVDFYEWLVAEGVVGAPIVEYVRSLTIRDVSLNERTIRENYFADIDQVLDYINLVGSQYGVGGEQDLLQIKAVAILSWLCIPHRDIVSVRKDEVAPSTQYSIQNRVRYGIALTPRCITLLKSAADASMYRTLGGKTFAYCDSEYLIRAKGKPQIAVGNLNRIIAQVNDFGGDKFHKYLSINTLQKNALLYQMMQIYGTPSRHEIMELLQCNEAQATWWKSLFDVWYRVYHAEGVLV